MLQCDLLQNNCSTFHQNPVLTIPCDFKFVETDSLYPEKLLDQIDVKEIKNNSSVNLHEFECEERDETLVKSKSL